MYPIPAKEALYLSEVADHWAAHMQPQRPKQEYLLILEKAWWRGEFFSENQITRLGVLKGLYKTKYDALPFWVKGKKAPKTEWKLPDGSVELLRIPPIPLPSSNPEDWTDTNCESAFEVIAEIWGYTTFETPAFEVILPIVYGVRLSEIRFSEWIESRGFDRPEFWARSERPKQKSTNKRPRKKSGPSSIETDRVEREMRLDLQKGKLSLDELQTRNQDSLATAYKTSRYTMNKARDRILSEFVGVPNSD